MVEAQTIRQLLAVGHESRSFEVKGPGLRTNPAFCATVARAVMAMGNIRDGGLVCIGVDDNRMSQMLPGLQPAELLEWTNYDEVSVALARYSDPPVTFGLHQVNLQTGVDIVVLEVEEFSDTPHICKRAYPKILNEGATYVRPRRKPESVAVPTSSDMRDLLDLATSKRVREFRRLAGDAGLLLGGQTPPTATSADLFNAEYEQAWSNPSEVVQSILASGHTDVAIRPEPFDADRLPAGGLTSFVESTLVRMRGWPLPYIDDREPFITRDGAARATGQDIGPRVVPHVEAWRICTSGQFLHRRVLTSDLRHAAELEPTLEGATGSVVVWDVLLYLVEAAEFAARTLTSLDVEALTFQVHLRGVKDRQLISGDDWHRDFAVQRLMPFNELTHTSTVDAAELLGETRQVGVRLAQGLLRQFGVQIADQVLLDWQDEVFGR